MADGGVALWSNQDNVESFCFRILLANWTAQPIPTQLVRTGNNMPETILHPKSVEFRAGKLRLRARDYFFQNVKMRKNIFYNFFMPGWLMSLLRSRISTNLEKVNARKPCLLLPIGPVLSFSKVYLAKRWLWEVLWAVSLVIWQDLQDSNLYFRSCSVLSYYTDIQAHSQLFVRPPGASNNVILQGM